MQELYTSTLHGPFISKKFFAYHRVMDVWKYLFLIFKSNYSIEAFTLLVQYHFLLPPMLAERLKWERFVNCHAARGKNISMDLHMEHLNGLCKTSIQGLGANKSEKAWARQLGFWVIY